MPCSSDYLDPSHHEQELQRAAKLLVFVRERLGRHVEPRLEKQAANRYATVDYVAELCSEIKFLTETERDQIIYNAHNKTSRDLADWWDEHLLADQEREDREKKAIRNQALRDSALAKLSEEEREVLFGQHDE